jgi:hypothetical protein
MDRPLTPMEQFVKWYEDEGPGLSKALQELLASEEYAAWNGWTVRQMLLAQKLWKEWMAESMAAMHLPSLDDVKRIGEQVLSLEFQLEQLKESVEQIQAQLGEIARVLAATTGAAGKPGDP